MGRIARQILYLSCAISLGAGIVAQAASPAGFVYTGVVQTADGMPLSPSSAPCVRSAADTCDLRVRLYDASEGGKVLWEQVFRDVEIGATQGRFTLALDCEGNFAACWRDDVPDLTQTALYAEVTLDPRGREDFSGGITFARTRIAATPYALAADDARLLGGVAATQYARTDASAHFTRAVAIDGTLTLGGAIQTRGALTINETQLVVANGKIGIGTATPVHTFDVVAHDGARIVARGAGAPALTVAGDAARDTLLALHYDAEAVPRLAIDTLGALRFGGGALPADVALFRAAPGVLATDGALRAQALRIGTDDASQPITTASGAHLTLGGTWTNASDRNLKENFLPIDSEEILQKIVALPIMRWNYKIEDDAITHIGPTAQDFHAAFGLGGSETSISTVDPAGVALAAIQALAKRTENADAALEMATTLTDALAEAVAAQEELRIRIAALEAEVASLRADRAAELAAGEGSAATVPTAEQGLPSQVQEPSSARTAQQDARTSQPDGAAESVAAASSARSGTVTISATTDVSVQDIAIVATIDPDVAPTLDYAAPDGVVCNVADLRDDGFTIRCTGAVREDFAVQWSLE